MTIVCVENYFSGQLHFEDGLPCTTKNENGHGYGLKSIRYIAESHGGMISASADGEIFNLTIAVPMSENAASSRRTATRSLVLCALMAALTAICSQIQIPLPMVPINLALFAVHLSGALLGWKYGALSMVVYALLGVIGVPVFAGFGSGPAVLFGKTGGYILGYILCALIVGALSRKFAFNFKTLCLSMVLGVAVCYTFGTIWFMAVTGLNLATSMSYCVIPFLPGDAVKILLAAFLALRLRKPLAAQGFAA